MKLFNMFNSKRAALAVAVTAGAFAPAAWAQSSVTLHGLVDVYGGVTKPLGAQDSTAVINSGGMTTSFWGITGQESLGGGLKTVFTIEGFLQADNGRSGRFAGDGMFTRDAFVGLSSDTAGTLRLGRITTPLFFSTILYNPMIGSFAFSPMVMQTYMSNGRSGVHSMGQVFGDTVWDNSIAYNTRQIGGLSAMAIYSFGERAGSMGNNKWSGNVMYSAGPLSATLAYQQIRFSAAPGDLNTIAPGYRRQDVAQAGATYDFGVAKVYAQYQHIDNSLDSGNVKSNGGQVGVAIPMGPGSILASYGYSKLSGLSDVKRKNWGVGYDYQLSKRTDLYAMYYGDRVTGLSSGYTAGLGIRTNF